MLKKAKSTSQLPVLSDKVIQQIQGWHIGVDEAGRGCLAGPVVAGAVLAPNGFDFSAHFSGLTDSKALKEKQRNILEQEIKNSSSVWAIGFSWPKEIDEVNILNATFRAMSRAIAHLLNACKINALSNPHQQGATAPLSNIANKNKQFPYADEILASIPTFIDGPHCIPAPQWQLAGNCTKPFSVPQQQGIVKGDLLIPSISAAAILAKVQRDRFMEQISKRYPAYNFAKHKGYGTEEHRNALDKHGFSPMHRKTFRVHKEKQHSLF